MNPPDISTLRPNVEDFRPTFTPPVITTLGLKDIFVFGSNLRGIHGAGAAKYARTYFGAETGVGVGRTGQCYALPTKDEYLRTLGVATISLFVDEFLKHAGENRDLTFLVTPIGCGLARLIAADIAPLFFESPRPLPGNVVLPKSFYEAYRWFKG